MRIDLVAAALPGLECGLPVGRNIDAIAQFLENAARDFLVYDVVFGQQNMVRLALALRTQGMARHDRLGRRAPALGLRAQNHHEAIGQIAMRHRLQQIPGESQIRKQSPIAALARRRSTGSGVRRAVPARPGWSCPRWRHRSRASDDRAARPRRAGRPRPRDASRSTLHPRNSRTPLPSRTAKVGPSILCDSSCCHRRS